MTESPLAVQAGPEGVQEPPDPQPEPSGGMSALRMRSREVRVPSRSAEYDARRRLPSLVLPATHLADHADLAVWWAGVHGACPPEPPSSPLLVVLAADHGVAVRGVSALPLGWTAVAAAMLATTDGPLREAAAGIPVEVHEVDVAGPSGPRSAPFDTGPALAAEAVDEAVDLGVALAAAAAEHHDLVGLSSIGVAGTTTAAALVASALGMRAHEIVTRGSGIDDLAWMRKTAAVRDGLRRARLAGVGAGAPAADHLILLGSVDAAVALGFLVEAAARKLPVVLDGPVTAAAALLAQRVCPSARHWWLGAGGGEVLASRVQDEIGIARAVTPVEGGGFGALAAMAGVRTAAALLRSPTTDETWPAPAPVSPEP